MLPPRLQWCDPRPIPRDNLQEPVTIVLRDPGFQEATDDDRCTALAYFCQSHDGPFRGSACEGGPSHVIALDCEVHGLENRWPDDRMLLFPAGFAPRLDDRQLAWLRSEDDDAP